MILFVGAFFRLAITKFSRVDEESNTQAKADNLQGYSETSTAHSNDAGRLRILGGRARQKAQQSLRLKSKRGLQLYGGKASEAHYDALYRLRIATPRANGAPPPKNGEKYTLSEVLEFYPFLNVATFSSESNYAPAIMENLQTAWELKLLRQKKPGR